MCMLTIGQSLGSVPNYSTINDYIPIMFAYVTRTVCTKSDNEEVGAHE
jgi:hypothetical protein